MQATKFSKVLERAARESGKDEAHLQSMANFIFPKTKEEMGGFNQLSINFRGMFTWFYGHDRLKKLMVRIDKHIHNVETDTVNKKWKYTSFLGKLSLEELRELKVKVLHLLEEYKQYIQEKKDIRNDNNSISIDE